MFAPPTDAVRIARQQRAPLGLVLWRALQPLRRPLQFMQSGAHPDDETSGMLAALSLRDGFGISYVCATRGEGGQNDIGREAGGALGTLRTAEMERAADMLGLSMYWLSRSPDDPITDFGFSKSGTETLAKWGRDHTLRRLAEVIRADRPDILCPTFLDIPGQHGHHRAMTEAAHLAMEAAADPGFPAEGAPWAVAKLYLPAWSGAGDAYDDDLPPPSETARIPGVGREPPSGWTWDEIGQHSRACHATQGMGRWTGGTIGAGWPLHLAVSRVGTDGTGRVTDNLPACFADLVPGGGALDAALAETVAAWPDAAGVVARAADALAALRACRDACSPALADQAGHRLDRAEMRLGRVIALASGIRVEVRLPIEARPGDTLSADLRLTAPPGAPPARAEWALPPGWTDSDGHLTVPKAAPPADPYPATYHAHGPRGPVGVTLTMTVEGQTVTMLLPNDSPMLILPRAEADVTPGAVFCNALAPRPIPVRLSLGAGLNPPADWRIEGEAEGASLIPPPDPATGLTIHPVTRKGEPAQSVIRIDHPHTGPLILASPATLRLRVAPVALARGRTGYIGAGHDRVDHWLHAMGAEVEALGDAALTPAGLDGLDTLVLGIFALRFRPGLPALMPAVHDWVRAGGNLVTLYHRPWDNWSADTTPPARLEIGKPSLRWRVTDEGAKVCHLIPDHPVLTGPNAIGPDDWAGWVKERGLYFAKSWDPAYEALLEMADPDEPPHRGALISARLGRGRHTHCALILHLQMEALVPGAFRLMANLIAPGR